ncbi:hypothetical protein BCAR13_1840007 [Paraburkholderia caribensis]|nr:hypothetical protein BCAR13_1840007 [Paraburkholderia caribensis]
MANAAFNNNYQLCDIPVPNAHGFVQNRDYETKEAHLGYRMRFCVVTEDGRLVCGEDGDLH